MASDSDNDAGTSIASDPGTHGPPCRIAAVATAQQRKPPPPGALLLPGNADAAVHKPVRPGRTLVPAGYGVVGPVKEKGEQEVVTLYFH